MSLVVYANVLTLPAYKLHVFQIRDRQFDFPEGRGRRHLSICRVWRVFALPPI